MPCEPLASNKSECFSVQRSDDDHEILVFQKQKARKVLHIEWGCGGNGTYCNMV